VNVINDTGLVVGWFVGRVPPHRLSATLMVKGTFRLDHGGVAEPMPPDEQEQLSGDVHREENPERSLAYASDFALHKPRTDLLLVGTCHAPGGNPTTVCRVAFRVGSWSKSLAVIGDRVWKRRLLSTTMSDPVPFTTMDLSWENSFGGSSFARNPAGRGFADEDVPGQGRIRRLPNVEWPENLMTSPGDRPEPAGYGPVSLTWPQRMSKAGTFDKKWLKESWPWFPDDADWTIFNAAPEDQQLRGYLRGDETVSYENLNPALPVMESRLPSLRMRWFVRETGESAPLVEVPLRLDTLFVDARADKLILVWRGVMPVRTKQLKEVADHYIVSEPLEEAPLTPPRHAERLAARKAEIEKERHGETVDVPSLPPLDIPEPSTVWADEMRAEAASAQAEMDKLVADAAMQKEELRAALKAAHRDTSALDAAPVHPPSTPEGYYAVMKKAYEQLEREAPHVAASVPPPRMEEFVIPPPEGVPALPPLPAAGADEEKWTRDRCLRHAAERGSFAGQDLRSLDLSGLDLHGLDFNGAVLQEANLAGANLAGADLSSAILTRASIPGANLQKAILREADLAECVLTEGDLTEAVLEGADFAKAKLAGAMLSGISAAEAIFTEADLTGARLTKADVSLADFDSAALAGADFARANARSASMDGAKGAKICMDGADVAGLKAAGAIFPEGTFREVKGGGSVWENAVLDRADFSRSDLAQANFEGASLVKGILRGCELRGARLPESRIEGADFTGSNLFHGTLEGASLSSAIFRDANLYEAELYEARGEGTSFDGANLKGTKLA
jgi:uncharacterized protein YjbI with pentapeptide repeats